LRWLFFAAVGYFIVVLLAFFFRNNLMFIPMREVTSTPADSGLVYEDVRFSAADGTPLHGWFLPGAGRGTVLFCHGNAGNIGHRLDSLEIFHSIGLSVFLFDYRGYGKSDGSPTIEGVYSDLEGAWKHLTKVRGISPEEIVLFGRSLGGAVAAWGAEKYSPAGLILESTFTTLADAGRRHLFFLPVGLMVGNAFDTLSRMKNITCPVLVASSPDDEIVPGKHGLILYDAAGEPKAFLPLIGGHNDGFLLTGQPYIDGLDKFFRQIFPPFQEGKNEV
ncbi:MAG: alpha/beta hydrolase, partial [Synergistaceae bacterium]|nr:alpha/beta hydrolase [Synergistaceae bacterium]